MLTHDVQSGCAQQVCLRNCVQVQFLPAGEPSRFSLPDFERSVKVEFLVEQHVDACKAFCFLEIGLQKSQKVPENFT